MQQSKAVTTTISQYLLWSFRCSFSRSSCTMKTGSPLLIFHPQSQRNEKSKNSKKRILRKNKNSKEKQEPVDLKPILAKEVDEHSESLCGSRGGDYSAGDFWIDYGIVYSAEADLRLGRMVMVAELVDFVLDRFLKEIRNMITGTSQAECDVLVIGSTTDFFKLVFPSMQIRACSPCFHTWCRATTTPKHSKARYEEIVTEVSFKILKGKRTLQSLIYTQSNDGSTKRMAIHKSSTLQLGVSSSKRDVHLSLQPCLIQNLKSCEPKFLASTLERLVELVKYKTLIKLVFVCWLLSGRSLFQRLVINWMKG
ncbi:hypothetical protein F2P56_028320 [Juglans regia]|uniref:Uncharacterized protein n=1 Tax=Juglans regia TaxID=51240 RepID=A0A833U9G0_JUGRE|nr:hypothetical protein F2P56_028320 [Juglans regia]